MAEFIHEPAMAQAILERFSQEESSLTQWMQQAKLHERLNIADAEQAGALFYSLIKAQAFWPQIMFGQATIPTSQHQTFARQVCTMFLAVYGKTEALWKKPQGLGLFKTGTLEVILGAKAYETNIIFADNAAVCYGVI